MHAGYRCAHSGACCTAGWDIAAEPPAATDILRRFTGSAHHAPLLLARQADGRVLLGRTPAGACVFFDDDRLCAIHRELGEGALPTACRQFPRVTLTDPRGRFITLSHFCPTAAGLLFSPTPVAIVEAPDGISLHGTAEGLDATTTLPPLLRPGMLMDLEGYSAWESAGVTLLGGGESSADDALNLLAAATNVIQRWTPAEGPLADRVRHAFANTPPARKTTNDPASDYAGAVAAVPSGLAIPFSTQGWAEADAAETWREYDAVVRRYLAAKLFGSWWPYLGLDLAAVVRATVLHASVLRVRLGACLARGDDRRTALLEAVRESDLLMVHLVDAGELAQWIREARAHGSTGSGVR